MNKIAFHHFFHPMPEGKVCGGFLEVGTFAASSCQLEVQVPFFLGPDQQVWALVGSVESIPEQVFDQAEQAGRILDEAEEAFGARSLARVRAAREGGPELCTVADFLFWLEEESQQMGDDLECTRPLQGVIRELRALGYRPAVSRGLIACSSSDLAVAILDRLGRDASEVIVAVCGFDLAQAVAEKLVELNLIPDMLPRRDLEDLFQAGIAGVRAVDWRASLAACLDKVLGDNPEVEPGEGPLVERFENASRLGDDGWLEADYEDRTCGID